MTAAWDADCANNTITASAASDKWTYYGLETVTVPTTSVATF